MARSGNKSGAAYPSTGKGSSKIGSRKGNQSGRSSNPLGGTGSNLKRDGDKSSRTTGSNKTASDL